MVSSRAFPTLERKPGGPDNWVEAAGGLPDYIERIAKHLHYEQGMTISHAIATAVNTVKRWAHKGGVVKYGDPHNMHVTTVTAAQAAAAVAQWEAKKRAGAARGRRGTLHLSSDHPTEALVSQVQALMERARSIEDPERKVAVRARIYDLAVSAASRSDAKAQGATMADGSYPIRNLKELKAAIKLCGSSNHETAAVKRHILSRARALGLMNEIPDGWKTDLANCYQIMNVIDLAAMTKDGRPSFKRQGKWGHGFVPLDAAARRAKAKGSPIAGRRIQRLFGSATQGQPSKPSERGGFKKFLKKGPKKATSPIRVGVKSDITAPTEAVQDVGQAQRLEPVKATRTQRVTPQNVEVSRGRRPAKRSTIDWEKIPEAEKTIRGGKRYVLTTFNGRQSLTEWTGPTASVDVASPDQRDKVMRTISTADLTKLTTAAIRRMLEMPNVPDDVRSRLNKELARKERLGLTGGKTR